MLCFETQHNIIINYKNIHFLSLTIMLSHIRHTTTENNWKLLNQQQGKRREGEKVSFFNKHIFSLLCNVFVCVYMCVSMMIYLNNEINKQQTIPSLCWWLIIIKKYLNKHKHIQLPWYVCSMPPNRWILK